MVNAAGSAIADSATTARNQFTDHEYDPESALAYMGARYYDPAVGRFLERDPALFGERTSRIVIGLSTEPQLLNAHAYALNRPTTVTDPTGGEVKDAPLVEDAGGEMPTGEFFNFAGYAGGTMGSVRGANGGRAGPSSATVPGGAGVAIRAARVADKVAGVAGKAGDAGRMARSVAKGKAGEAATGARLGDRVAGKQVTFQTSKGTRSRADFVTKESGGHGVTESKAGPNARLSNNQKDLQADIDSGREVVPVGRNAERAGLEPGKPTPIESYKVDWWPF
jgi:RHS repeat-associated protein